jgi:hypothetical protein
VVAQAQNTAERLAVTNLQNSVSAGFMNINQQLDDVRNQVNYGISLERSEPLQNLLESGLDADTGLGVAGVASVTPGRVLPKSENYYDSLTLPLNPPGRGDYAGFSVVGYLQLEGFPDRMLALYGRRLTPKTYQYYTINHIDPMLRVPVRNTGDLPLITNQMILVPGYSGRFRVVLYGPDYQSYAPY